MLYVILPRGSNFGWGICGKYLVKELAELTRVNYITEAFDANAVGDDLDFQVLKSHLIPPKTLALFTGPNPPETDSPVLQAITGKTLAPWGITLKSRRRVGYTFFENDVLNAGDVQNGKAHFDLIVAGSTWCQEVLKRHGLPEVTTIIQGVDPQLFNPAHAAKELFKDRFVVFSGGKFELRKGQDIVIRAFKVLQDRHPDVMLVTSWFNAWAGSMQTMQASPLIRFQMDTKDYMALVKKTLVENGIDPERVLITRPCANAQMARIYKNTDVGLFPNRCEGGTNLVLMEYMACGKPAIASDSSGHKDILAPENSRIIRHSKPMVIQGPAGERYTWDDPDLEETVAHLERAYQNRGELEKIGQKAGQDLSQLTWKACARKFHDLLFT